MSALTVSVETPQQAEVFGLLRQSDAYSASLCPVEGRKPPSVATLSAPDVHFLVARMDGVAVGCCALIAPGDGTGELKRMRRCCTDRRGGCVHPNPRLRSGDADGLRASQFQHAVEDVDGDVHLGRLAFVGM